MQVFKFGGASVSTPERIGAVADILKSYAAKNCWWWYRPWAKPPMRWKPLWIFLQRQYGRGLTPVSQIKNEHLQTAENLQVDTGMLNDFFTEIEWLLHDKPVRAYDYYYDQVVCVGELLSSAIVSAYLNAHGVHNNWIDVRDVLRTDDNFRDARINWSVTAQKVEEVVLPPGMRLRLW